MAPFEKMQQENREAAHQFALLGLAHALDFLGDRLKVGFAERGQRASSAACSRVQA